MEEYKLVGSEEASKTTFAVITNLWDYKLRFLCPVCGLVWQTKEYSLLLNERPDSVIINCSKEYRDGCDQRYKVIFDWRDK